MTNNMAEQEETDGIILDWANVDNWEWVDFAQRYIERAHLMGYDTSSTDFFCKVAYLYDKLLPLCHRSRYDDEKFNFPFSDDEIRNYPIFYTSAYGSRDQGLSIHYGTDFGCPVGIPIRAVSDGVVTSAGEKGGYDEANNVLCIQHLTTLDDDTYSRYFHCSEILVKLGETVRKGQVIAKTGNVATFSTGPHLHFELSPGDSLRTKSPVDPMSYYPRFLQLVQLNAQLKVSDNQKDADASTASTRK